MEMALSLCLGDMQVECAVQLAEQGCMEGDLAAQGLVGSMHLVTRALGPDHPILAHILLHRARLLRQHQQYHQVTHPPHLRLQSGI